MELEFQGTAVKGLGEGAHFIKLYSSKFKKCLGFEPYPGTINIEVNTGKVGRLEQADMRYRIHGFQENGSDYGAVLCHPCTINGMDAFIVLPERSSHKKVMEVIANKELDISMGMGCSIRMEVP